MEFFGSILTRPQSSVMRNVLDARDNGKESHASKTFLTRFSLETTGDESGSNPRRQSAREWGGGAGVLSGGGGGMISGEK